MNFEIGQRLNNEAAQYMQIQKHISDLMDRGQLGNLY